MDGELISVGHGLPRLYAPDDATKNRVIEFFVANIRNPNTRRAYARTSAEFAQWCDGQSIRSLREVRPLHVATYIEQLNLSAPSVKQRLAALRVLFDRLVAGHAMDINPAASVRGPKHSVKKGKTPVLTADEARALLNVIDTRTIVGLRDRALISLMIFTFARVGAAIQMRIEDVYMQGRRTWVRLHEKGGKQHEMPCHHILDEYLHVYMEETQSTEGKQFLFRTAIGRTNQLSERPMLQADVYRMIGRRAITASIETKIGCHSFRAVGITEYLRNGGKLEIAQQMANHESARTTGLYDRRNDQINLGEVERIVI
ncbi:MAG: int [Verrucomicrobiaceae bacterium]|nr:int [Verrucomicrobiaceae bacterium]